MGKGGKRTHVRNSRIQYLLKKKEKRKEEVLTIKFVPYISCLNRAFVLLICKNI